MRALPAILTLLLTLTFVGSAFVSGPFGGFEADQLPIPQVDPPAQPAGWAFSIWGLIYGWLLASAAFGLWRRAEDADWDRVRLPLALSLAAGTPWLAVAQASAEWAAALILVMAAPAVLTLLGAPDRDRWWLRVPVGLYAGWLVAASFVALASVLAGHGVLMGGLGWAVASLGATLAVAVAVLRARPGATAFAAAVAWALVGVAAANWDAGTWVTPLAVAAIVAVVALAWRPATLYGPG